MTRPLSPRRAAELGRALVLWFENNRRDLPWRKTSDPYAIWVSELMLQQTQVSTAAPYYERWMRRFPDVTSLARATDDQVLELWQGLGYYRRARNLRRGAQVVVERYGGTLPASVDELLTLPGIGPYSAGAIASIAFNIPTPLVDGNVVRVLCRLFALRGDPARAPLKAQLWQLCQTLIVPGRARDSNQALMELGATTCTPKNPGCGRCPVANACAARRQGSVHRLPELAKRKPSTAVQMVAALLNNRGRMLVVQLPATSARWAGMWQFPNVEVQRGEALELAAARAVRSTVGLEVVVNGHAAVIRHSVTRFRITLDAFACQRHRGRPRAIACADFMYADRARLASLAMPAAHRRLATAVSRERSES